MTEKSKLEVVANSTVVSTAANAIGIFGATITPLAAFIPFLVQSLGSARQSARIEKMLEDVKTIAENNADKIHNLSDDQYKVVNEAVSAAFYTVNEEKLHFLRNAIKNSIETPGLVVGMSDAISRVIRDISVDEVMFILKYKSHKSVTVYQGTLDGHEIARVMPGSFEEVLLSGVINLGLAYSKTNYAGIIAYEWSPLVEKLVGLLNEV